MSKSSCFSSAGSTLLRLTCPLILASASPRRSAFLRDMGLACEVVAPAEHAEPFPMPGEVPEAFAARAARAKAEAVFSSIDRKSVV